MGDIGDYWRDHKEYVKEKKNKYRGNSSKAIKALEDSGIEFYQLSHEHYRVPLTNDFIDWWPSTGTWRSKDGKTRGWQVRDLIKEVRKREKLAA